MGKHPQAISIRQIMFNLLRKFGKRFLHCGCRGIKDKFSADQRGCVLFLKSLQNMFNVLLL